MPIRLISTLSAAGLIAAVAALSPVSQAAHSPVAVFPAAGVLVASPKTQISFRGATPDELRNSHIRIKGSVTGTHSGTIKGHSDGNGASFLPSSNFHTGEHVRVYSDLPLVGESSGYVRFQIAHAPGHFSLPDQHDQGGHPPGEQDFKTRPDLHPPSIRIDTREPESVGQGDLFVGAKAGPGQDGTMVSDDRGKLIWFKRAPSHRTTFDFRRQIYKGQPVLTWWQGRSRPGQGLGSGQIYDTSYHKIADVQTGNGYEADLHEFEISPDSTGLVLAYDPVEFGNGVTMDEAVQEIDIPTGLVMYEWHSLGQISSKESWSTRSGDQPYDVAHVNSIQKLGDGNFLISARHTNTIYKLNGRTGKIIWRLGGRRSDFKMNGSSQFLAQHTARLQADGSITVYDNGGPPKPGRDSRALWLNVDEANRTVSVRHSYHFPGGVKAFSQGGVQLLPSGDVFVGWGGSWPYFTQFTAGGHIVWNAHFDPKGDDTYRAYRFPWSAQPGGRPAIAAIRQGDGKTRVYASWNGATEIVKWRVLQGPAGAALVPGKTFKKSGFEDFTRIPDTTDSIAVQALGAGDQVLGTSTAVQASG